jgi:hypothetical protein
MEIKPLYVVTYGIPDSHPRVEITMRGKDAWAVVDGCYVLNKLGEWEHEPLPSSRDAEFIGRTRWATAELAYKAYRDRPHGYQR